VDKPNESIDCGEAGHPDKCGNAACIGAGFAQAPQQPARCGTYECRAAQRDGVICENGTCDIADGARAGLQAAPQVPSAWMARYVDSAGMPSVYVTTHHELAIENDDKGDPQPLYATPPEAALQPEVVEDVVQRLIHEIRGASYEGQSFSGRPATVVGLADVESAIRLALQGTKP
jgi:hypothetical protein